jgi:hypothetical protein
MMSEHTEARQEQPLKRHYVLPEMVVYGSAKRLTTGGSKNGNEGTSGPGNTPDDKTPNTPKP